MTDRGAIGGNDFSGDAPSGEDADERVANVLGQWMERYGCCVKRQARFTVGCAQDARG
jgi:hypothetical protein